MSSHASIQGVRSKSQETSALYAFHYFAPNLSQRHTSLDEYSVSLLGKELKVNYRYALKRKQRHYTCIVRFKSWFCYHN